MTLGLVFTILGVFIAIAAFMLNGGAQHKRLKIFLGVLFIISAVAAIFYFLAPFPFPPVPPTPPVTVTIGPIPTVPPRQIINADDFSSLNSGWNTITDDPDGTATYSGDGRYQMDVYHKAFFSSLWPAVWQTDLENSALEVDVLGSWGDGGALEQGIVIGWNEDVNTKSYALTLTSNGKCMFRVWQIVEDGPNAGRRMWEPQPVSSDLAMNMAEPRHKLLLVKRNNSLFGYVDGRFCGQYEMANYQGGYIGLAMLSPDAGGKSYFDDFVIYSIP
jgi:hypothetical protein